MFHIHFFFRLHSCELTIHKLAFQADELLKLLREEKELLGEYTTQLKNQKDSQMALVRKVEERERQIQVRVN